MNQDYTAKFESYLTKSFEVITGKRPLSSLQERPCGSCNMCCHAPAIASEQLESHEQAMLPPKPAGVKCRHCTAKGCGVYQNRPNICEGYLCLWAFGMVDTFPMDGGVCWTFQPCGQTGGVLVMGHCLDADEVLRNVDNRRDIRAFMAVEGPGKPVAVVLRSGTQVVRFDNLGMFPDLMADIDASDPLRLRVDETTQRRARWSVRK